MAQWNFPSPYCLFVRTSIRRERYSIFKEMAGKVAFAYRQHSRRMPWSAYATVAGASLQAYIIIPLETLAEMDEVLSLDRVMLDVYGEEGRVMLAQFQECVLDMSTSVINRIKVAIDPPVRADPPQYLYYVHLHVRPSHAGVFLDGLRRAGEAMPHSPIVVYGTFAGPTRVHGFVMGDTIGDLAGVGPMQNQILSGLGREEGDRIISQLHEGLVDTETSILRYIGHQGS